MDHSDPMMNCEILVTYFCDFENDCKLPEMRHHVLHDIITYATPRPTRHHVLHDTTNYATPRSIRHHVLHVTTTYMIPQPTLYHVPPDTTTRHHVQHHMKRNHTSDIPCNTTLAAIPYARQHCRDDNVLPYASDTTICVALYVCDTAVGNVVWCFLPCPC